MIELTRSLMYFVGHPGFTPGRGYVPLALTDHGRHEDAEFVFVNDAGETRFVSTQLCHHVAPRELSQTREGLVEHRPPVRTPDP